MEMRDIKYLKLQYNMRFVISVLPEKITSHIFLMFVLRASLIINPFAFVLPEHGKD